MNELSQLPKNFNEAPVDAQSQIVEEVYEIITYTNPLASECEHINQKQVRCCPKCGKSHFILNGKRKGIQCYKCKECGRSFSEFSNTTISYIKKKDKLKLYILLMLRGASLDLCSKTLHISIQTSFDWRHKIISALGKYVPKEYHGITEMISIEKSFSRKGQGAKSRKIGKKEKITDPATNKKAESQEKEEYKPLSLVAISDRTSRFEIRIIQQGELEMEQLKKQLDKKLNNVKKLCLDEHGILQEFAGKKRISYFVYQEGKKSKGRNKYYNTENVENRYIKLNRFLERFHGVSSSYLQNYLNWYMMMDWIMYKIDSSSEMIEKSMAVPKGKELYKKCKMFA